MNRVHFAVTALATLTLLNGCARFNMSNGSTDYKATRLLEPLNVPSNLMMRPQKPLYPAPLVDQAALANAPNFSNSKGNRFELPRAQSVSNPSSAVAGTQFAISKPILFKDGSQNPLLKIDGNADEVWQRIQTAASVANLKGSINSKAPYQYEFNYSLNDGKEAASSTTQQRYFLRLTPTGASHTVGIYMPNNRYAPVDVAESVLNSIVQNWSE